MGLCAKHATMTPHVAMANVVDELQVVKLTHAHTNSMVLSQAVLESQVVPESQVVLESQVVPVLFIQSLIFLVTEVTEATDMDKHIPNSRKSTKPY